MNSLPDQSRPQAWLAFGVFAALCVLLVGGLVFVVPVFAEMFADYGTELPKPTQIVIDVSMWLKYNVLVLVLALFGPLVGGYFLAAGDEQKSGDAGILWGFALCLLILIGCVVLALFLPTFQVNAVTGGP